MTKAEFLHELANKLKQLPAEEINQQQAYYEELLADMMEDGISEEEAVSRLGNTNKIAEDLLRDQPIQVLMKKRFRPKNGWTVAAVAASVLGAPLWVPLLLAFILIIAAVVLAIGAVIFSLFVCVLAFACAGVMIIVRGFWLIPLSGENAVCAVGIGFLLLGLVCLAFLAAEYVSVGLYRGGKWIFRGVKALLVVKEG